MIASCRWMCAFRVIALFRSREPSSSMLSLTPLMANCVHERAWWREIGREH